MPGFTHTLALCPNGVPKVQFKSVTQELSDMIDLTVNSLISHLGLDS